MREAVDVQLVDAAAHPVATGQMGSLVVKLPLPPGCVPTLWQQDAQMVGSYFSEFPGFYKTGDAVSMAEGATFGMHRPIGSQPAISWASLQIS